MVGFRRLITGGPDTPLGRALIENSYPARLERRFEAAKGLSSEHMEAYIQAYEAHGFPKVRRFFQTVLGGSGDLEGNGDPAIVNAYRQTLDERSNLEE